MSHVQSRFVAVALAFLPLLTSCTTQSVGNEAAAAASQGWRATERSDWYRATQGSRLIPLAWLRALERADGETAFLGPEMATRYRLLAVAGSQLPVGFAVDDGNDENLSVSKLRWFAGQATREKWVGLNCSACHSGEVRLGATVVRIDGGPALFDYQSFVEDLDAALRATLAGGDAAPKWQRFAAAALGAKDSPANRQLLRAAASKLLAWEDRVEAMNATPLRYGFGRVDAFGHIFNKIALFNGAASPTPNAADAPVSYPHIWDIYRHDKLQWNGIAENQRLKLGGARYLDYGALGRNTGEVLGVFGDVVVTPGGGLGGFKSSVQADNLIRMETLLTRLQAPKWPVAFGALDAAQVAAGSRVFARDCIGCHAPQPGTAPYAVKLIALADGNANSTDPWMACNAISYRSATGKLEGTPRGFIGGGEKFGAEAPVGRMLETTVKGTLVGKKGPIIAEAARVFFGIDKPPRVVLEESLDVRGTRLAACFASGSPNMAYKSRPLDGIWATAPYLHNGSVPTLYDLLLPAAQRPAAFAVGTREYDPARGGYVTAAAAPGNSFVFRTRDESGAVIAGNDNAGHEYGAGRMTAAERSALLEYLKSL